MNLQMAILLGLVWRVAFSVNTDTPPHEVLYFKTLKEAYYVAHEMIWRDNDSRPNSLVEIDYLDLFTDEVIYNRMGFINDEALYLIDRNLERQGFSNSVATAASYVVFDRLVAKAH